MLSQLGQPITHICVTTRVLELHTTPSQPLVQGLPPLLAFQEASTVAPFLKPAFLKASSWLVRLQLGRRDMS